MIRKFLLTAALAFIAALAAPSSSQAALVFSLTINGTTINDGGLGDADGIKNGTILVAENRVFDGYKFSGFSASSSSPTTDGGTFNIGQGGKITNTINNAGLLTVTVLSDGFVNPVAGLMVTNTLSNTLFQGGGVTTGQTTVTPGGISPLVTLFKKDFGSSSFNTNTPAGLFTMSNVFTLNGLAQGNNYRGSLSSEAIPAPAPAGLILAALGLPAFGLLRRKFRKVVA